MMIMKKLFLILLITFVVQNISAQAKKIERLQLIGLVTDFENNSVRKCTIFIDSAITTTKTNKKGLYKIKVPSDISSIAVYSEKLGMIIKPYEGTNTINFKFPRTNHDISERDLAALGFRVNTSGLKNYGHYITIYDLIRAEFAGVIVRDNVIQVRGSATFDGNSPVPLYLVDDSYVSNLDFVNTNEIKSIEILKGEDAALYGSRGAHGVIIINLIK